MKLTKNEKKVLKLLIDNAKLSDISIANKLNISGQAVGKIRHYLEQNIIKKYTLELDYPKLGITSISLINANYQKEDEKELMEKVPRCPRVINIFKLARRTNKFKIIRLNFNLDECEKCKINNCELLEISEIDTIPISNIIKNDINPLFHKAIDELGEKHFKFNEKK